MEAIDYFYSGVTADGKMIPTPAFIANMERCERGHANDSARLVRCACDADSDPDDERNAELQRLYDAARKQARTGAR
jgi:hypothetical protein